MKRGKAGRHKRPEHEAQRLAYLIARTAGTIRLYTELEWAYKVGMRRVAPERERP